MNQFDVAKWNKNRYLTEANLQESKAQEAATAIDKILDKVDPAGITPEDLGEAIAIIVKKGYQKELQEKFMDALHKKLGYPEDLNEAKDDFYPDSPEALRQATQNSERNP
jgi:DNA-directed RNA polymerase specialized sigma54-like protein